jgi:hypothetical protein
LALIDAARGVGSCGVRTRQIRVKSWKNGKKPAKMGKNGIKPKDFCGNPYFFIDFAYPKAALF